MTAPQSNGKALDQTAVTFEWFMKASSRSSRAARPVQERAALALVLAARAARGCVDAWNDRHGAFVSRCAHYTTVHYSTLHYSTLHYTTLHYITLHYTALHCITLQYTTLHYIALYHSHITTARTRGTTVTARASDVT